MNRFLKQKKIIIIYLVVGFAWIYFSDKILLFLISDIDYYNKIQDYKGFFYVLSNAILLYLLISKYTYNINKRKDEVDALNEQLMANNEELVESLDELNQMNERFISMINIVSNLNKQNIFYEDDFLSQLLDAAVKIVPEADYGKIYIIENDLCRFVNSIGHDFNVLKNIKIKQKTLFDYNNKGVFISDDYSINIDKVSKKYKADLLKALKPIKKSLYIDINMNESIVGRISLDIAAGSNKQFCETTKKVLNSFAVLASSFFAFKYYNNLQEEFTKELTGSIIKILEIYDHYTRGHSENVANLTVKIAERMEVSKKMINDAYWAGMVHDIGKLLVPVSILNKKGKLDDEEFQLVKKHPIWGNKSLSDSDALKHISKYILYHHERWDGKGYPAGLKNEEIPLISQMICVADSWDAMRSKRAYREPLSKETALSEIRKNKGTQFAPEVVDVFLDMIGDEISEIDKDIDTKQLNLVR
ncbi:HD-GYP domain-containing protein [Halanaerobium kushneri]|uniref:HD domain-containing protein n=1 Tax=Halanaerobium kushneri TaxID=56779 RepID=A0A1N6SKA0_9FIRM|nr:HD-GYP domain-containing protein [Halanaerobium kushneri]SIQ41575.1 HD domain-containing protein [Halanaerobium kushneri]